MRSCFMIRCTCVCRSWKTAGRALGTSKPSGKFATLFSTVASSCAEAETRRAKGSVRARRLCLLYGLLLKGLSVHEASAFDVPRTAWSLQIERAKTARRATPGALRGPCIFQLLETCEFRNVFRAPVFTCALLHVRVGKSCLLNRHSVRWRHHHLLRNLFRHLGMLAFRCLVISFLKIESWTKATPEPVHRSIRASPCKGCLKK